MRLIDGGILKSELAKCFNHNPDIDPPVITVDDCLISTIMTVEEQPTIQAIPLDRIKQAREELVKKVKDYSHTGEEETEAYKTGLEDTLEFFDKLIAESEDKE